MRSKFAGWWYPLLAAALVLPGTAAAAAAPLPKAKVEQAVIAALPTWQGKKAQIIDYLDLTEPFATTFPGHSSSSKLRVPCLHRNGRTTGRSRSAS
jgi:hypothetical protein